MWPASRNISQATKDRLVATHAQAEHPVCAANLAFKRSLIVGANGGGAGNSNPSQPVVLVRQHDPHGHCVWHMKIVLGNEAADQYDVVLHADLHKSTDKLLWLDVDPDNGAQLPIDIEGRKDRVFRFELYLEHLRYVTLDFEAIFHEIEHLSSDQMRIVTQLDVARLTQAGQTASAIQLDYTQGSWHLSALAIVINQPEVLHSQDLSQSNVKLVDFRCSKRRIVPLKANVTVPRSVQVVTLDAVSPDEQLLYYVQNMLCFMFYQPPRLSEERWHLYQALYRYISAFYEENSSNGKTTTPTFFELDRRWRFHTAPRIWRDYKQSGVCAEEFFGLHASAQGGLCVRQEILGAALVGVETTAEFYQQIISDWTTALDYYESKTGAFNDQISQMIRAEIARVKIYKEHALAVAQLHVSAFYGQWAILWDNTRNAPFAAASDGTTPVVYSLATLAMHMRLLDERTGADATLPRVFPFSPFEVVKEKIPAAAAAANNNNNGGGTSGADSFRTYVGVITYFHDSHYEVIDLRTRAPVMVVLDANIRTHATHVVEVLSRQERPTPLFIPWEATAPLERRTLWRRFWDTCGFTATTTTTTDAHISAGVSAPQVVDAPFTTDVLFDYEGAMLQTNVWIDEPELANRLAIDSDRFGLDFRALISLDQKFRPVDSLLVVSIVNGQNPRFELVTDASGEPAEVETVSLEDSARVAVHSSEDLYVFRDAPLQRRVAMFMLFNKQNSAIEDSSPVAKLRVVDLVIRLGSSNQLTDLRLSDGSIVSAEAYKQAGTFKIESQSKIPAQLFTEAMSSSNSGFALCFYRAFVADFEFSGYALVDANNSIYQLLTRNNRLWLSRPLNTLFVPWVSRLSAAILNPEERRRVVDSIREMLSHDFKGSLSLRYTSPDAAGSEGKTLLAASVDWSAGEELVWTDSRVSELVTIGNEVYFQGAPAVDPLLVSDFESGDALPHEPLATFETSAIVSQLERIHGKTMKTDSEEADCRALAFVLFERICGRYYFINQPPDNPAHRVAALNFSVVSDTVDLKLLNEAGENIIDQDIDRFVNQFSTPATQFPIGADVSVVGLDSVFKGLPMRVVAADRFDVQLNPFTDGSIMLTLFVSRYDLFTIPGGAAGDAAAVSPTLTLPQLPQYTELDQIANIKTIRIAHAPSTRTYEFAATETTGGDYIVLAVKADDCQPVSVLGFLQASSPSVRSAISVSNGVSKQFALVLRFSEAIEPTFVLATPYSYLWYKWSVPDGDEHHYQLDVEPPPTVLPSPDPSRPPSPSPPPPPPIIILPSPVPPVVVVASRGILVEYDHWRDAVDRAQGRESLSIIEAQSTNDYDLTVAAPPSYQPLFKVGDPDDASTFVFSWHRPEFGDALPLEPTDSNTLKTVDLSIIGHTLDLAWEQLQPFSLDRFQQFVDQQSARYMGQGSNVPVAIAAWKQELDQLAISSLHPILFGQALRRVSLRSGDSLRAAAAHLQTTDTALLSIGARYRLYALGIDRAVQPWRVVCAWIRFGAQIAGARFTAEEIEDWRDPQAAIRSYGFHEVYSLQDLSNDPIFAGDTTPIYQQLMTLSTGQTWAFQISPLVTPTPTPTPTPPPPPVPPVPSPVKIITPSSSSFTNTFTYYSGDYRPKLQLLQFRRSNVLLKRRIHVMFTMGGATDFSDPARVIKLDSLTDVPVLQDSTIYGRYEAVLLLGNASSQWRGKHSKMPRSSVAPASVVVKGGGVVVPKYGRVRVQLEESGTGIVLVDFVGSYQLDIVPLSAHRHVSIELKALNGSSIAKDTASVYLVQDSGKWLAIGASVLIRPNL